MSAREAELQSRCDRLTTDCMALAARVEDLEGRLSSVMARLALIEDILHIPGA